MECIRGGYSGVSIVSGAWIHLGAVVLRQCPALGGERYLHILAAPAHVRGNVLGAAYCHVVRARLRADASNRHQHRGGCAHASVSGGAHHQVQNQHRHQEAMYPSSMAMVAARSARLVVVPLRSVVRLRRRPKHGIRRRNPVEYRFDDFGSWLVVSQPRPEEIRKCPGFGVVPSPIERTTLSFCDGAPCQGMEVNFPPLLA